MLLWVLAGCADSGFDNDFGGGEFPPDMGGAGGEVGDDMGPPCPEPGTFWVQDRCVGPVPEEQADRCPFVADLVAGCTDTDGDCHVVDCTLPLPEALLESISDCDDGRGDVWAGAPELCDGRDNDCDGEIDEGFSLGMTCGNACGLGQVECSVFDPTREACSTAQGQSEYDPQPEMCDGIDNDCDDVTDERCILTIDGVEAAQQPHLCGDRLLFVSGDTLYQTPRPVAPTDGAASVPERVPDGDRPLSVHCTVSHVVWLQRGEAIEPETACADEGQPLNCTASVMLWPFEGEAVNITGLGRNGPPVLSDSQVLWHSVLEGRPLLKGWDLQMPGVSDLGIDLSDPSPTAGARLALRRWTDDQSEVLFRQDSGGDVLLSAPMGPAGPAQLSEDWLVWPLQGGGLWAVPVDAAGPVDAGFQAVGGEVTAPRLVGSTLLWLEKDMLWRLDLETGARWLIDEGNVPAGGYTLDGNDLIYSMDGALRWHRQALED